VLVVVCGILTALGPQMGNVFSKVTNNIAAGGEYEYSGSSGSGSSASSGSTGGSGSSASSGSGGSGSGGGQVTPENVVVVPYGTEAESGEAAAAAPERLIIREATITIKVQDPRASREGIEEMVASSAHRGAFVVSSAEEQRSDTELPVIKMSIRVPPAVFDEVMDRLATMAIKVHARNESAQDVTEEYVDIEGRVTAMEVGYQRLFTMMEATTELDVLLKLEAQVTERETEIEALRGRMEYLGQSAQLSKIDITLQPHIAAPTVEKPIATWEMNKVDPSWRLAKTAQSALGDLLGGVRALLNTAIYFSIAILPWLLGLGGVVYGGWRLANVVNSVWNRPPTPHLIPESERKLE
ncbi:MAG: DUF4349 domain-containing protein, partial [Ardenticatenales bacterium]|nr:DUF4349 domain-containing protein [Ardenticatenales bacterium]